MIPLYSYPTPNGIKVPILLEELGVPCELNRVDLLKGEQRAPEFLRLNPNGKIPVLVDPDGPGCRAITITESVAILIYLATKFGAFIPRDELSRIRMFEWLFFNASGLGPAFGQCPDLREARVWDDRTSGVIEV